MYNKNEKWPLVSIIIDNWNGKHFLKNCLDSVFNQNYENFEVIIIDDASRDGSPQFIKKEYKKAILIENKEHVGFAAANNQGISKAKGKYLLFLNNDTKVTPNFLYPLVSDLERENNLGGVQPKIKMMSTPKFLDDVASYLTPFGFLYHFGYREKDGSRFSKRFLTFSPKGACFLIPKTVIDKVGDFNSKFYCYFEESDLAWRIWLSGKKIAFEPESVIYHYSGGSLRQQSSFNRDYYAFRNRLYSLLVNLSLPSLIFIFPLHLVFLITSCFWYIIRKRWSSFRAIVSAIFWVVRHSEDVLIDRGRAQGQIRKITDWQLFKDVLRLPPGGYLGRFLGFYKEVESTMKS